MKDTVELQSLTTSNMSGAVPPSLIRLGVNVLITFGIVKTFPQYLPEHALLYVFIRLLGVQLLLVAIWKVGIYPFFVSPLRHLPGPGLKVSSLSLYNIKFMTDNRRAPFLSWVMV